jgi:hypothetical protein
LEQQNKELQAKFDNLTVEIKQNQIKVMDAALSIKSSIKNKYEEEHKQSEI